MRPLSALTGLAAGLLDGAAAALAGIPNRLDRRSHRIAVTGLRRSGKTVFVTAFAHALLTATRAPRHDFPFFPWRDRVQDVRALEIPGVPAFPFRERLDGLLGQAPSWPTPTSGLSGLRIRVRHARAGFIGSAMSATATTDLDLIDYPGEWLLDLPMLSLSFREWSRRMEALAASGKRAPVGRRWLEEAGTLDPDAREDPARISRIDALHREYLRACRDELGLYFLQPGRFLVDAEPALAFFPLSSLRSPRHGSNGAALLARYATYQRLVRRFYQGVFGRLGKQVLLVDLLTALQQGHESFADLGMAIRTVADAFEELKHPLLRLLPVASVDRLAVVAAKADHVTADQLNNLVGLLRDMIGEPFLVANARQAGLLAVASVRATTELRLKRDGESLPFLRGRPAGRNASIVDVRPGIIPGQIPSPEKWHDFEFNIRDFEPPLLPAAYEDRPLPHINLDKVLQFLLA